MGEKEKFKLIIILADATRLIIDDVDEYYSRDEEYIFLKNKYYSYMPKSHVMYIGRLDSLRGEERYEYFGNQ